MSTTSFFIHFYPSTEMLPEKYSEVICLVHGLLPWWFYVTYHLFAFDHVITDHIKQVVLSKLSLIFIFAKKSLKLLFIQIMHVFLYFKNYQGSPGVFMWVADRKYTVQHMCTICVNVHTVGHLFLLRCDGGAVLGNKAPQRSLLMEKNWSLHSCCSLGALGGFNGNDNDDENYSQDQPDNI